MMKLNELITSVEIEPVFIDYPGLLIQEEIDIKAWVFSLEKEKHIIVVGNKLTPSGQSRFLGISGVEIIQIIKEQYSGCYDQERSGMLYFKTEEEAQFALDNFFIPRMVMTELAGGFDE